MILAVTGHRPDKLGGYSKQVDERLRYFAYDYLCRHEPEKVTTGMALGWDMAVAEACVMASIPFTAAVSFAGQESRWPEDQLQRYRGLLRKSACVHYPNPGGYAPWKFQVRNMWMVDNSTQLCALWDGSAGGTANCVKYAVQVKHPIENLWAQWLKQ